MMKFSLILVAMVSALSPLWGAFWWKDTTKLYPPAKVYFRDAEGVDWRICTRLAETLFKVAQVTDKTDEGALLEADTHTLIQVDLDTSKVVWREEVSKAYTWLTTCNGILLGLYDEQNQRRNQFFIRDGKKWFRPKELNANNLRRWTDYKDGILLSGLISGEPLVYALSAAGIEGISGKPVTSGPWLGENGILGLSTYEAVFQIFDIQSGKYYSLPQNYQPVFCVSLQAIFVQEKTGLRRYAIYDVQQNKTTFLAKDTIFSAVDDFYVIYGHQGETHVYNSKGGHFKWPGKVSIRQIRCSPHEIVLVESETLKEVLNTTTQMRLSFDVADELSPFDTFLKVKKTDGTIYLIDLVTGEKVVVKE